MYLEGDDLQRTFQELRTSHDQFAVWVWLQAKDLLDGFDLTQTSPGSLSELVFDDASLEEDKESDYLREEMERFGMISP